MDDMNNQVVMLCFIALAGTYWHTDESLVLLILAAVFFSCSNLALGQEPVIWGLNAVFILCCLWHPYLALVLPVILYFECRYPAPRILLCGWLVLPLLQMIVDGRWQMLVWTVILCFLAVVLSIRQEKMERMARVILSMRDDEEEFRITIKNKNKELLERQNDEIYMATLRERNRIAREIHDNVGHLLSRSILQVGALLAVNKEKTVASMLMDVKSTLDDAMTSIRSSVHDLHDESVDLKSALQDAVRCLDDLEVVFSYDISADIDRELKYMFISIMKECANNIVKHSDGKQVCIKLVEHPGFYQMIVMDDGSGCSPEKLLSPRGIGLENIRQRVEQFHGVVRFQSRDGFKVFISVPKKYSALG